jgi:hypothetical protein
MNFLFVVAIQQKVFSLFHVRPTFPGQLLSNERSQQ